MVYLCLLLSIYDIWFDIQYFFPSCFKSYMKSRHSVDVKTFDNGASNLSPSCSFQFAKRTTNGRTRKHTNNPKAFSLYCGKPFIISVRFLVRPFVAICPICESYESSSFQELIKLWLRVLKYRLANYPTFIYSKNEGELTCFFFLFLWGEDARRKMMMGRDVRIPTF